ncbi:MAG: type I secretion outer membrane protein [Syntrophaceae bacterium]|nr:MAG: type I secretion outer membrane protein [Syntrophaceae bacterium]
MHKKIWLLVLLLIMSGKSLPAAERIQKGDVLTLQQCIDTAIKNHPAIDAAAGIIRQSESKIGQARAGYYPQINFQLGYSRIGPASTSLRSDPYNYYSNALNLNQTLFDFGKTSSSVDIQILTKQSTEADFQNTVASLVLGVKETYYSFLKAKMSETVAKETVNQFQQHFDVAETFFQTGKSSKIDVTSAEVNLSNARIQLISVQNALHIARVNLNKAMGVISAPEYNVENKFHLELINISFEAALAQAYENRPELLSTALKKEALEKSIDLNKKGYLPVLSGNAAYGYAGDDTSRDKSWNVGIALAFPLFTGLSTKYAVDEARANLDVARANEESLRQTVYQEVQSAWLNRREAFERIEAGRVIVRQAEENVELAKGRYETGVGNSIEITDAMIKLNNAKMTYITALSDFSVAQARLEKAMGVKK